jgi:cysteine-rich repeat protein
MMRLLERGAPRFGWALFLTLVGLLGCDGGGSKALCGNQAVDPGEECDDGNRLDGDGCSSLCLREIHGDDVGTDEDAAPTDGTVADAAVVPADMAPVVDARVEPLPPLSLNSLIPNRGLSSGGTAIRVIGTGFAEGIELTLDGRPCADLVVESENLLRCTTPPGRAGAAEVFARLVVSGADRRESTLPGGFTWYDAVRIDQVAPARIAVRGGVPVEIRGRGLVDPTRVTIAGQPIAEVELLDDGALRVLAPPAPAGPADVTVTNFNGQDTAAGALFYFEEVEVDALEPPVGPLAGGTPVTLRGAGLVEATQVLFGDGGAEIEGASADRTRLDVLTPAGDAAGPVNVEITNENGMFSIPNGFVYYDAARNDFSVAGIAPAAGPVAGGNEVFVVGSGFTAQTTVTFDARPVPCRFLDAHRLSCTPPPAFAGAVDVQVTEGADTALLADGYTYFETLELIAVLPDRGSIAGGTLITLVGLGFVDGMQVRLGELDLLELQVVDEGTAVGLTPPNSEGPVDVRVTTGFSRALIAGGFRYFNPGTQFGGVWGEPIEGSVNVTVLDAGTGMGLEEATVKVVANGGDLVLEGLTNAQGQITLAAPDLEAPLQVTARKEEYDATSFEDLEVENVTIYLQPESQGEPPPSVPAAILRGVATGLDLLPKPVEERYVNVIFIETTHFTPYDRNRMPAPGPGGLLFEDGPFEIIARPGELAIVATAAEIDRDVLKDYDDGLLDYWTMRTAIRPLSMGLRRFISASPGATIDGLDVVLDHPMDFVIPVDLDNPPLGMAPGPQYYGVLPRLQLGAEGYWELDTQAVNIEPNLSLRQMPRLDGWDRDVEYYLISLAFSDTPDNTPMSVNVEVTRDVEAGVLVTPFVGSPFFINPAIGGNLGPELHVTWGVSDGFDGPILPPSANLVTIAEPALGPPKIIWTYVTPSLTTEFVIPQNIAEDVLNPGLMYLNIYPFLVDGDFDFDDFTYDELNQYRWKTWGVATTTFRQ